MVIRLTLADGFPNDFSILATFRAVADSKSMLFTIYSSEGDEILSLRIARRLKLTLQSQMSREKRRVKFGANLADGR